MKIHLNEQIWKKMTNQQNFLQAYVITRFLNQIIVFFLSSLSLPPDVFRFFATSVIERGCEEDLGWRKIDATADITLIKYRG